MTSPAGNSNDLQLIDRFKGGDAAAFEEIVLNYQDGIYSLCRRMLSNAHDAEDAAQDVFLKAYRGLPAFRPEASLSTWLHRIAVNTCIDHRRKPVFESLFRSSGDGEEAQIEAFSGDPSPERLYESRQMGQALQRSLGRLSGKLRAAIVLKEMEGLSYEEIADVLGISLGTVKSRIARARDELQKLMKDFTEQN
jgi:RNA polymerase sigma-70 factor, ECF subfamily